MAPPLRLFTLGTVALRVDVAGNGSETPDTPDARASLSAGKPLALVAFLHCTGGTATREQLVDHLWADVAPISGRHTLRQTLWYLRKRLGDEVFATDGELVRLVAPVSSDRAEFLAALDAGHAERAFALYDGDFMPGFASPGAAAFEQWADLERQRLRALFIGAAGRVVRASLEAGRARDALLAARRARDLAPASQATWRMVIESLLAADDLVGAKAESERLQATLLSDDLEAEPATQQLLRTVERGRPRPANPAEPRPLEVELVGRDTAFAALLQAYERAARSLSQHVHVSGPAGLGKSRLIDGLAARLRSMRGQKARVVLTRATPAERALPFAFAGQLVNALVSMRGAAAVSRDAAAALVALAPAASTYLDVAPDRSTGDEALRRRTLAVTELVAAVADDAPLALLIDDVHWMDTASRTLVAAMSERLTGAQSLLVTTGRGADGFAELVPSAQHIPLTPLTMEDVTALVTSVAALPFEPWAELFPARLATATNGSPLLIMETLQLAIERGQLVIAGDSWQCAEPGALLSLLGAGHALQQRLGALPATARDVLLALSLAGEALNEDTVRRIVGVDVHEALTLLDTRGLAMRSGQWWRPAHDEIAALAADLASSRDRGTLHAAIADWIETQPAGPRAWNASRALWHRWRAGDRTGAQRVARRLVEQLRTEGDSTPTVVLLRDALGSDATDDELQRLAASLPGRRRRFWCRAPWILSAASLTALAVLATRSANNTATTGPAPDVSFVLQVSDSVAGSWEWTRADVSFERLGAQSSVELSRAEAPLPAVTLDSVVGLQPVPTTGGSTVRYVGNRLRNDRPELALDLVAVNANGDIAPLYGGPRDQAVSLPSPTGRTVAFVDRAHWPTQAADLSLLDLPTGAVTRLTNTPADEKVFAWSPDGRQLAFVREFTDATAPQLCRLRLADRVERCTPFPADYVPAAVRAWRPDDRLVLQVVSRLTNEFALVLLSTDGTQVDLVHEGANDYLTDPTGQLVLCECRLPGVDRPAVSVMPVDEPQLVRPLRQRGRLVHGFRQALLIWTARAPQPVALRVLAPDSATVGERIRLGASARDARGRDLAVPLRRWQLLDPALGRIDSSGTLSLLATGTLRVVLNDGSRLTDTARIAVIAPNVRPVLRDRFAAPLADRWYLLGSPRPTLHRTTRGTSLHMNGDDRLHSGVVSRAAVDARGGVGVRVRFRLPIDRAVWQSLYIALEPVAPDSQLRWLEARPDDPVPEAWQAAVTRSCRLNMPRSEGGSMRGILGLYAAGLSIPTRRVAPPFGDGAVHEAELQLYADGRCAVSLDGELLGVSENTVLLDMPLRVHLSGQSVGTLVEVEEVEFWEGVRTPPLTRSPER